MEYVEGYKTIRRTFMDVLLLEGETEAVEACGRMADWFGLDADEVKTSVVTDWREFRRRFEEAA